MEKVEIRDDLRLELKKIIEDKRYFNDIDLIENLSTKFAQNGLPRDIPNKLFMGLTTVGELTEVELIWLVDKLYEYEIDGKKVFPELIPQKFFSDIKIINAKEFVPEDKYADKIVFKNVTRINKNLYVSSFTPAKDIALYKKSELFSYEFDTQRPGKLREIGTKGTMVKEIFLNEDSVFSIGNLIYDDKYTPPDTLTMNIPIFDGNTPNVTLNKNNELIIVPNYDTSKKNVTICNVTDGWHRVNASEFAYNKKIEKGEDPNKLTNGFVVIITLMTPQQARNHFKRINTYNPIEKSYLETFNTNDETKFIDALVNYKDDKNIFVDNVLRTFEETKAFKKLTYHKVLEDAIKQTNVEVTNVLAEMHDLPKIVKFITKFIDYIGAIYFKDSNDVYRDIKRYTNLLDMNIFIGYFVIADKIQSENEINKWIIQLEQKLNDTKVKEELKTMGLNNKNYSAKKIADYFNNLF